MKELKMIFLEQFLVELEEGQKRFMVGETAEGESGLKSQYESLFLRARRVDRMNPDCLGPGEENRACISEAQQLNS